MVWPGPSSKCILTRDDFEPWQLPVLAKCYVDEMASLTHFLVTMPLLQESG